MHKSLHHEKRSGFSIPGLIWFWWIPLLFGLDQISKWFVLKHLSFGEFFQVFPGLHFTLSHNRGIAFSLFNQGTGLIPVALLIFILIICVTITVWLAKTPPQDKWSGIALAFILGGALGNFFDRLYHGYVIDFIDFYFRSWHWYTFNLADFFISVGALMLFKTILFPSELKG